MVSMSLSLPPESAGSIFLTVRVNFIYTAYMQRTKRPIFTCWALLVLVVMLLSPMVGVCHDGGHCASSDGTSIALSHGQADAPCCPDADHHDPAHDSCAACPCHAPLPETPVNTTVSLTVTVLTFMEPSHSISEVYLSLFDTPDVAA